MMLYEFGKFIFEKPSRLFLLLLILGVFLSIFSGDYILFPKNGYDENYDRVVIIRIFYSDTRGSEPGIEAYSLIDKKNIRYDGLINKRFFENIEGNLSKNIEIDLYWYYTGLSGFIFNERAVIGYQYEGIQVNDINKNYHLIKNRKNRLLVFSVIISLFVSGFSIFSIIFYALRRKLQ